MALPKVFFLLLPLSPLLIMAALYLLPNKLARPPLPPLLAKGEEGAWWVGEAEQGPRGRRAGLWAAEPRYARARPRLGDLWAQAEWTMWAGVARPATSLPFPSPQPAAGPREGHEGHLQGGMFDRL